MIKREYVEAGAAIRLCGESAGGIFQRVFHIDKKLEREGASSVCYEAHHEGSGIGILKEFYPQDSYVLERNSDGQLVPSPEFRDGCSRFRKAEQAYVESHKKLLTLKQSKADPDLATFIPVFEIYHGCDPNGNIIGTTYIWNPEPELETFETICDEIHRNPDDRPEYKLITVLHAIESLTKCTCALHHAELLHRDIKPSNFGFRKRGNETLTQTLSMFDLDTICSVYDNITEIVGTEGYLEPEAGKPATNQTDIYSIGATLFHAVIVTNQTKASNYLYKAEYYGRLSKMVDESRLICALEANPHPIQKDALKKLKAVLTEILQKCLCRRADRYVNCEALLEDLKKALFYALPSEIAKMSRSGERWVLEADSASENQKREKNAFLAIQYHLYEHPLYECSKDDPSLKVLLIGFGAYGQKFLDACLQNGQMRNKRLSVTVFSEDQEEQNIYLRERPALKDFFHIDGIEGIGETATDDADAYGVLSFETAELQHNDPTALWIAVQELLYNHYDSESPHYIFIALGEDGLNTAAAMACRDLGNTCVVSYILESSLPTESTDSSLCPLYVNADIRKSPLYPEIERMAFNTHLIWEKNLNVSYRSVRADFRKPYNHDSSVSSVLSMKYKLYSMGIDLKEVGFEEAARLFTETLADKKASSGLKNELIWIEHRRWVTEKLCQGYRKRNLEDCATGTTQDKKEKNHVCILRSRPDQKLTATFQTNGSYKKWDTATDAELSQLDELDRMSVELHRIYEERARQARQKNLLSGNSIELIQELIEGDSECDRRASVAFQEWYSCMKEIWHGNTKKVREYKGLKNAFLDAAKKLPGVRKKAVCMQAEIFDAVFYPIIASKEYRDWKKNDVDLIDNIPFILTYTTSVQLVIPFDFDIGVSSTDNTALFRNVSAPTVVAPSRIFYLCYIEKQSAAEFNRTISELRNAISSVTDYMKKKNLRAAVEFILLCEDPTSSLVTEQVKSELIQLDSGRIKRVSVVTVADYTKVASQLEDFLKHSLAGRKTFAAEMNQTTLSFMLKGAGFYQSFPHYQFDSCNLEFSKVSGCALLNYIKKARTAFLSVADMLSLKRSSSESSNQPEFYADYKALFKLYRNNSKTWKELCGVLGEYAQKNDVLVRLREKKSWEKSSDSEPRIYILPFECKKIVDKIISELKRNQILEKESCVSDCSTDSFKVEIVDRCGYLDSYDKLFSNIHALLLPDFVHVYRNKKSHEVIVEFDSLVVNNVPIGAGKAVEIRSLMKELCKMGYVINLKDADGKLSFTYSTRRVKELLTTEGKILEVYVYHKAKELGQFDDIVSGYEINWEDPHVTNEFDCILTKGFRTLFVECKASVNIEQNFYYKLSELTKKLGINATAVLVADTQEKPGYDRAADNETERNRGKMMDVVTVWKPEEINNIGHTLLNIINGKYTQT